MEIKAVIPLVAFVTSSLALSNHVHMPSACENSAIFFHASNTAHSTSIRNKNAGGRVAEDGSHPHMVALTLGFGVRLLICGGSLISFRTVLTAAHCICPAYDGKNLSNEFVGLVGTNNWRSIGQSYTFLRNITYPQYYQKGISHDIALLITTTEVSTCAKVNVIPMSFDLVSPGTPVKTAGWGRTHKYVSISPVLLEFMTVTIDSYTCVHEVVRAAQVTGMKLKIPQPRLEICTFHSEGNNVCQGDAGSGLVHRTTGRLVGVVTWGVPCEYEGPDMYLRLSKFHHWIVKNFI